MKPSMLVVILAALLARLAFQVHLEAYPKLELIRNALDDQVLYDAWAKHILAGTPMDWAASGHEFAYWAARTPGVFPQDPLYSYALAGFYRLSGFAYGGVRGLQALLGVGTALLVWRLAARVMAPGAALAAGLLAALYQPLVFYEATFLREPLATFFAAGALVCVQAAGQAGAERWRAIGWATAGGLLLGLAVLTRSHLALPALALALWLLAHTRRGAAALGAALLLVLAPVVGANVVRSGGPAFVSSAGPYNLFVGNVHDADGGPSPFYREVKAQGPPAEVDLLGALAADVAAHPGVFLRRQLEKTATLLGPREHSDNVSVAMGLMLAPRLRWAVVGDAVLMPLALLGLALALARWRTHALWLAWLLAAVASIVPFIVVSRLRLPLLPALALAGGVVAERALALAAARRWPALGALALAAGALALWLWPPPQPHRHVDYQMAAAAYETLGQQAEARGDAEGARRAFGRAVALNPEHQAAADAAERLFPGRPPVIENDAVVLAEQARDEARDGRYDEALRLLEEAARRSPDWALPWRFSASVRVLAGDRRSAVADLERAVALDPRDRPARAALRALRREVGLER
jgi:tetratricopeptide (TPR) repeat protein